MYHAKKTFSLLAIAAVLATTLYAPIASAHCQIPCGIYGDQTRFVTLYEHITTIEKSMNQIDELSQDAANNSVSIVVRIMST